MSLPDWLKHQGWPHGFECIGVERLQQVWDAAKEEERKKWIDLLKPIIEIAE